MQAFKMVLVFEDDTLVTITGDFIPTTAEERAQEEAQEDSQEAPAGAMSDETS